MTPDIVGTILTDLLAQTVTAFSQAGAPTAPTRRLVHWGQPAVATGEQIVVWLADLHPGSPFPLPAVRAAKTTIVLSVSANVEVWRACWPDADVSQAQKSLPGPQPLTDAALALTADASTVMGWLADLSVRGGLLPNVPGVATSSDVKIGTVVPLGPSGGLAGWRLPITVKVP